MLCRALFLDSTIIETDSLVAVLGVKDSHKIPWQYGYEVRHCAVLLGNSLLVYVYRERNRVPHRLAASATPIVVTWFLMS